MTILTLNNKFPQRLLLVAVSLTRFYAIETRCSPAKQDGYVRVGGWEWIWEWGGRSWMFWSCVFICYLTESASIPLPLASSSARMAFSPFSRLCWPTFILSVTAPHQTGFLWPFFPLTLTLAIQLTYFFIKICFFCLSMALAFPAACFVLLCISNAQ